MTPPEHLTTERLVLRVPDAVDAAFVYSYASDPAVARYMMWPRHTHADESAAFVARCRRVWAEGVRFPWLLTRRADGAPLGMIELHIDGFRANIGYVLHRAHWGNGYMPEAAGVVRDWAMAQPEIYRFWSYCDADNHASMRVMEKIGMTREGRLRRWVRHPNAGAEPRDAVCYALVK